MGCLEMTCANFANPIHYKPIVKRRRRREKKTPSIESLIDVNHAN